ncbi:MAG: ABC transporter substrate-binding protein [Clostridiales bacterium]|nr:ABC transporter substrate-binding protein [Clostridiales bacterium]
MNKRFLALTTAALLSLSAVLTGCGGSKSDSKVLTMATNAQFPPYEYYEGDKIVGIDAEIAEAIADKLGMTLKIEDVEFDSVLTGVQSGKYDIGLAGITVTPERQQSMDFSDTYATGIQSIIVPEGSEITSVDDLMADGAAYKVGVQLSTTGDIYATDDFGADRVQEFQSGADAVAALTAGKIDCVIIDNQPAKSYVAANEGLTILDSAYTEEEYALCTAKGNDELLTKINGAIAELKEDGTIQSILDKYIVAD